MKNVHPLQITALLLTLLLFLSFQLHRSHEALQKSNEHLMQTKKVALQLAELQSLYNNHEHTKAALQKIVRQSSLRDAKLSVVFDKTSMKISAKKISRKALKSLMGKILNTSYNIKKLTIKRLSKTAVSLDMEIAL